MPVLVVLMLFSITTVLFPSCEKEDDIPPPSAYVPPEPTEDCIFLFVTPELSADVALDFECEGPEYTFFGELDGSIAIEQVDNPSVSGINTSEKAIQVTQSPGIEPWAGFFFDLAAKVDFSTYQGVKIKVYSPAAGQVVNLKLEDSTDGSISSEVAATTTVANEWEELCFPFSSVDSDKFDRFVLFFNFFGSKDVETVHYFDDIILADECMIVEVTEPTTAAPTPTTAEEDVISIFSDAYPNIPGTDFNPDWGQATVVTEVEIEGNNTLKYEGLNYQGINFESAIDVSEMSFLHVDYWTGNSTGLNGSLISSGPVETPYAFDITTGEWVSVDIPLSEFSDVVDLMDVIQMKFDGNGTIFLDNIYFYNPPSGPTTAAPTPTIPEADVISMFSDAYMDVPVDTWQTEWSNSDFEDVEIMGNPTKKYSNLGFVGVETVANQIDASELTHFHVDIWTPDASSLRIKLVDFGADGGFEGGDDAEHELTFESPQQGQWVSLDIPLADFVDLTTRANLAQLIFSGDPFGAVTLYVDNVFFYKESVTLTEPAVAAPTPTLDAANVISMFSDAYMDVPVDTWQTEWSNSDFEDVEIMGNPTKKYTNLGFVGVETVANQIDASSMTHFHVDVWTPDATTLRIKLVDFGADGAFQGGDDVEHELTFESPQQGGWISLDIPLSDFVNLTTTEHIAQLIFSGDPFGAVTLFVDNVYFHN